MSFNSDNDVSNWQDARERLRKWREENERKSEEVVNLWITYLGANSSKLGDEKWMVLEQVVIAALDVHNYPIAEDAIFELKTRFPSSDRVRYLQVLRLHALEKYDEALKCLDTMIKKDNTNSAAYKRKIAILKSQGKTSEAIKELAEYLNKFMSDQEAWSELCDLYLSEADYSRAAFCAEELILHNPHNFFVHQRLADIRYTMGGIENLKMAVSYYTEALKLNADSMRALFGLFLAASSLGTNQRVPAPDKKEYTRVMHWAADEVSKRYNEKGEAKEVAMIEGVMGALQI
jgi:tetratricopeptide (TPR) repeat protein